MGASRITMWKNVNGVYTADPRRVPEAFPIASLKYDEAIELPTSARRSSTRRRCCCASRARSPSTCATSSTRRTRAPSSRGALALRLVGGVAKANVDVEVKRVAESLRLSGDESPIRGITSVDNVAIVTVDGTGTAVPDLASRIFGALHKYDVQVVMVTQASADSSVCLVVEEGVVEARPRPRGGL